MTVYNRIQRQIATRLDEGSQIEQWSDWRWQLRHQIHDIETAERLLGIRFEEGMRKAFQRTVARFPMRVTPYYLSLIDTTDPGNCPVFRQAFPSPKELEIGRNDLRDPLAEDADSPVPGLTHRYPDRVLFHVSNLSWALAKKIPGFLSKKRPPQGVALRA